MGTRIQKAYGVGGPLIDVFPAPIIAERAPTSTDTSYPQGQSWFDNSGATPVEYIFDGSSTWNVGGNAHATTTEYGTVILNDSVTMAGATDDNVPTSLAIKTYADNLAIAGAPAWSETISGIGQLATTAEAQAATDDTVAMTPLKVAQLLATPPAIGGTTPGAGSFSTLAASGLASLSGSATITTGATALNLASDASTGAVNIGTGAGARTITIGNVTGATAVAVNTGTGHFTVTTTGAGDILLNSADTVLIDSAGVLELNSSAGVIGIGNDAVAQAINIGTGAAARTITIGNSTGATSLVLNCGTGALNIGTNAIAHTITLGNSTGATSLVLDSGTGPINVGTNAVAHTVTIGNITGATAVNINTGTAGSTYTTTNGALSFVTGTGAINVGADAAAKTITIGNGTGATSVVLNCGTGALNIGTNAIAHTITIGNITGATAVNVNSGTGACAWTTTNGAFSLVTGTGAINVGADAAAKTITIGNTTGATAVNITAGSGSVNCATDFNLTSVATKITMNGGAATDFIGTATLVAGTVTVNNTNIAAGDRIMITRSALNASPALGFLIYTISAGASFTVSSLSAAGAAVNTDVSSFTYVIVRQTQ